MLPVYLFLHSLVFSFHHILINVYLYANCVQVYGALRMSVKMFLMWNSQLLVDGGGDAAVATSLLEASNLLVLRVLFWHVVLLTSSTFVHVVNLLSFLCQESSSIHSNSNLGVHGQGLLNLTGPGDLIEAQRLVLSLFYSIHVSTTSNSANLFYQSLSDMFLTLSRK